MTRAAGRIAVVSVVALAVATTFLSWATRARHVQDRIVNALGERLDSEVAVQQLQVSVVPAPELSGAGMVVRWNGRTDVPPLVRVGAFSASAGLAGLVGNPVALRRVELEHLEIQIPPGGIGARNRDRERTARSGEHRLVIDEIIAHAARLTIIPRTAGKLPRIFDVHDLHIDRFGEPGGSEFRAVLTNPLPEGLVQTQGRFGPWVRDEPRRTPLRGHYKFNGANLDTIKGLGGTLSSRGTYSGVLERIDVVGETETPNFSIDIAGQPLPLTTRFKAVVDGTNGDTWLEEVDARLLESRIQARGAVVRAVDVKGRHVALDITVDDARIEDLLRLAIKTPNAPLMGAVRVKTKFFLPAGEEDVVRKLRLDGDFALDRATFANLDVQRRISALSQRGKGDETPDEGQSVVSKLRGRFELKNAVLRFSNLTFAVPGAMVQLAGNYHLEAETLDFTGHLLLDASLRDTTSGFKSVLATLVQPFFRRPGGGSKLPIRVNGTRGKPQFGLDMRKAFLPGD